MFTQSIAWDHKPLDSTRIFPHSAIGGQKLVGLELKNEHEAPDHQILFCLQDNAVVSIPYIDNKMYVDGIEIYMKADDWTLKEIYENIIKPDFDAELSEWQPIYE